MNQMLVSKQYYWQFPVAIDGCSRKDEQNGNEFTLSTFPWSTLVEGGKERYRPLVN